jgi:hypothetical protein
VAIAIVGYFMYTKVSAQNQEMIELTKRCDAIEMLFARPPPPDDLQAMYRPKYPNQNQHVSPPCKSAMCDLEPLQIDTNEAELDHIVDAELSKVIEEEARSSPKRKRSTKKSDNHSRKPS